MGVFVGYKGDHLKSFLVENFPKEAKSVAKNFQGNDDVAKMLLKVCLKSVIKLYILFNVQKSIIQAQVNYTNLYHVQNIKKIFI